MVTILMMSAKMATLDLLKTKLLRNNDYEVIIPAHDITNKISSRDSNYIDVGMWSTLAFLWEKFLTSMLLTSNY